MEAVGQGIGSYPTYGGCLVNVGIICYFQKVSCFYFFLNFFIFFGDQLFLNRRKLRLREINFLSHSY